MSDEAFMRRALELARVNVGATGDNPSVGCVLVRDGAVIGEGATQLGGRPHAEEQAVGGADAKGATAYVTLEPCARRSSGGVSCTDLLIAAGVSRVVIAARDPHPFANGTGITRMRDAGIVVELGLLESEACAQSPEFFAKWDKA